MIRYLRFDHPVTIIGTSLRVDEFDADLGWHIEETPNGVRLWREAIEDQNVPAVAPFRVVGVGYGVREPHAWKEDAKRTAKASPSAGEGSAAADGGTPAGPVPQPRGGLRKARRGKEGVT